MLLKRALTLSGCLLAISGCVRFGYEGADAEKREAGGDLALPLESGVDLALTSEGGVDLAQTPERVLPSDGAPSADAPDVSQDLGSRDSLQAEVSAPDQAVSLDRQAAYDSTVQGATSRRSSPPPLRC